jgi:MFS family permease
MFFGLFSAALLLSAVIGPSVGRLIDRHGGRVLLACSNLVIATGLVILASAHGIIGLVIAWTVLGVGIGMGLYDPAFAALTWLYGREARSSITGITLIAGFASTIGWPMSAVFLLALHPAARRHQVPAAFGLAFKLRVLRGPVGSRTL